MFDINNNNYDYNLYLCKTDKTILTVINAIDIDYTQNFRTYDELSFEIPLYENGWMKIEDKTFNLLQPNYLVLMEVKNNDELIFSEYFIINAPALKDDNGVIKKLIQCYSSEYIFNNRYLRSYTEVKVLYDLNNTFGGGIINYMLDQMKNIWKVGYISNSFYGIYHSFNYSSNTYKSVLDDLQDKYNCYIIYDTIHNEINIYTPEEVGESTNIVLNDQNYLKSLSCDIKNSEMCTRLRCHGKDNISIMKYNISGQMYLDNFDFYQNNGYFSESLNTAMNSFKTLLASKQDIYTGYVNTLDSLDSTLLTKQTELNDLNAQLTIYKDNEDIAIKFGTANGQPYSYWYSLEQSQLALINSKQSEINSIQSSINNVNNNIITLRNQISYENNFSDEQLKELSYYIIEGELKLDSVIDEKQLYEYGMQYIVLKSVPPIDINIDLVDLYSLGDSYIAKNYDKIKAGNFVYVDCPELGFNYDQYRITQIRHNKLSNSLSMTISNKDKVNTLINYLNAIFKQSSEAASNLNVNHESYGQYTQDQPNILTNTSTLNTATNPIVSGGVQFGDRGMYMQDINNPLSQMRIYDNMILLTDDGWATKPSVAISGSGINADIIKVGTLSAININGVNITGSTITGSLLRTSSTGGRIEINSDTGFVQYDSSGNKTIQIYSQGSTNFGTIFFWSQNEILGWLGYSGTDMRLYNNQGHKLYLGNSYSNSNTVCLGTWDCIDATFVALYDGTSYYATRSWVQSQGYLKNTSGYTGNMITGDGKTAYVLNGLIYSIT